MGKYCLVSVVSIIVFQIIMSIPAFRKMQCTVNRFFAEVYTKFKVLQLSSVGKWFRNLVLQILRTVVDFLVFWVLWFKCDGKLSDGIHTFFSAVTPLFDQAVSGIETMWSTCWEYIVFLSPYGREAASSEKVMYCIHWSLGCAILFAVLTYCIARIGGTEVKMTLKSVILSIASGIIVWYAGFLGSFVISLIPFWFYFLSAVLTCVCCLLIWILDLWILSEIDVF